MLNAGAYTLNQILSASLICVFLFFALISTPQARSRSPRVKLTGTTELEARFFRDVRDRKLSGWSLSDAFFIASGIRDERSLGRARAWLDGLVEDARVALKPHRRVEDRADHLLRWMHERALSRYYARSTSALELINSGSFNCLSSCLLYGMIGDRLGLNVRGIIVDKHAFCRVYRSARGGSGRSTQSTRGGWDVETTTALGFNPGREVQLDQRVISVPRSRYRNRREVSLFEMIGLIYTNHMGLSDAYPSAEERLLAYQKAALFFPRDGVIQHNIVAAHTQVILTALNKGRWRTATEYLEQLSETQAGREQAGPLWLTLVNKQLERAAARGLEGSLEVIDSHAASEQRALPDATWRLWRAQLYAQAAVAVMQRGEVDRAIELLDSALREARRGERGYQRSPYATRKLLKPLHHNCLLPVKNLVITLLNARQLELAQRVLKVAQRRLPRDATFSELARQLKSISSAPPPRPQRVRVRRNARVRPTRRRRR